MKNIEDVTLSFIRILNSRKVKSKNSVLNARGTQERVSLYRFDPLEKSLTLNDIQSITQLFLQLNNLKANPPTTMQEVFELLIQSKMVIRLERHPSKIKSPLLRWPKDVQISSVN